MSTRTRARHVRPFRLIDPPDREGTCGTCREINVLLTEADRLTAHRVAGVGPNLPTCAGTGSLAIDPHDRPYFHVEGVQFL